MQRRSNIPEHAKKVFSGVIFDVYQWEQELFDGSFTTFEMASRANAVSIIPIIDDEILVLHEEQPGHQPRISFPGGHIEPDEDIFDAAARELHEETGMVFKDLRLVMIEDIGGSKLDWWAYRFVAQGLIRTDSPHCDPGEKIETERVSFETAQQLAKNNIFMSHHIIDSIGTLDELKSLLEVSLE